VAGDAVAQEIDWTNIPEQQKKSRHSRRINPAPSRCSCCCRRGLQARDRGRLPHRTGIRDNLSWLPNLYRVMSGKRRGKPL